MLLFFSYWTYKDMEILIKDVVIFWLLDLYGYGTFWVVLFNFSKLFQSNGPNFYLKMMLFIFSYWTYMGMEILKKNVAFF